MSMFSSRLAWAICLAVMCHCGRPVGYAPADGGDPPDSSNSNENNVNDVAWSRTYGGSEDDTVYGVLQTSDGGYIVAGNTASFVPGAVTPWIVRLDAAGEILWERALSGGPERVFSMARSPDQGFVLAGRTDSPGFDASAAWILKVDEFGEIDWLKVYDRVGDNDSIGVFYANEITPAADGGYVAVAVTGSAGAGNKDVGVLKVDGQGQFQWLRVYGGMDDDFGVSLAPGGDGGSVVAAETFSFGTGDADVWILKLDRFGESMWQQRYGADGDDSPSRIRADWESGYVVTSTQKDPGSAWPDTWILRIDDHGQSVWEARLGGEGYDRLDAVGMDPEGGYVFAGWSGSFSDETYFDLWVVNLDADGIPRWQRVFVKEFQGWAQTLEPAADGGYVVAGSTYPGTRGTDFWVLKLDPNGTIPHGCPPSFVRNSESPLITTSSVPRSTTQIGRSSDVVVTEPEVEFVDTRAIVETQCE